MSDEGKENVKTERILVVDGSPATRNQIKGLLKNRFELSEADSAQAALSTIDRESSATQKGIDTVIVGTDLPGSSYRDFAAAIRNNRDYRYLNLILVTPNNEHSVVVPALDAGFDDYIVQPLTQVLLNTKIDRLHLDLPEEAIELADDISRIQFFDAVPARHVAYLINACSHTMILEPGENVCEQDEENFDLFILVEGQVDIFFNRKKVADLKAIDTIGEMGFIERKKRSATVMATEPVKVLVFKREPLDAFLNEERAISETICKNLIFSLNDRVKRSNSLIQNLKSMAEEFFRH